MAPDTVLFIGWNRPLAGRDRQALQVFESAIGYYAGLVSARKIDSFEPVLLAAHAGDLNGFVMLRGTRDQIDAVRRDDKFIEIITRAQFNVDQVGAVEGWVGQSLQTHLQRWAKLSSDS